MSRRNRPVPNFSGTAPKSKPTTGSAKVPMRVRTTPRRTPTEFMPTPVLDLSRPRGYDRRGPFQVPRNLAADL